MTEHPPEYLTTRELAELLRIKERKVYDMAAAGQVPCVRATGKLLFPAQQIAQWMQASRSGPSPTMDASPVPDVVAGSHDPLLDWALRESGSGLASFFDGSLDGLERLKSRQVLASGIHIHEADGWNTGTVTAQLGNDPIVLVEFAKRQRGVIVPAGNPNGIATVADLRGLTVARRQSTAASQLLFDTLAGDAGILEGLPTWTHPPARTEEELASVVFSGKADAAFGLACVAAQYRLGFAPLLEERFDLLVWRQGWFSAPFQQFLDFASTLAFREKAAEFGGYDITGFGHVHLNGTAP